MTPSPIDLLNSVFYVSGVGLVLYLVSKYSIALYQRLIRPAKEPLQYGKWGIITGSTSGIGKDFVEYLARKGMSVLVISRTEDKLKEQQKEIEEKYDVAVKYLPYDFTDMGPNRVEFYKKLSVLCEIMHKDGGIGLLVNNVGTVHYHPQTLEETTEEDVDAMLNCNMNSVVHMTRAVLTHMKERRNGCVLSISSGSCYTPNPFIAVYAATKAFVTQFSRSMHVECWGSGVDFYVATPLYVVSNLYKRKEGSLFAPLPETFVRGVMAQLGKGKFLSVGHGYWYHGFLGFVSSLNPLAPARRFASIKASRARWQARQQKEK